MSLFTWASAYWTQNITWAGASWSPSNVVNGFFATGVPYVGGEQSQAVDLYPGERIRVTVRYRNPSEVPAGIRVYADGFTVGNARTVLQVEGLDTSGTEQVLTTEFVWEDAYARMRPLMRFYGDTSLVITRLEFDRVSGIDQYVRSYQADDGTQDALWAVSEPGDLAVLVMASQYGDTAAHAPEGWTEVHTPTASPRAGYVATRVVADPSETVNVVHRADDDSAARKRGLLVVLKGQPGTPEVQGWQEAPFALGAGQAQILFSQRHSVANAPSGDWSPSGGVLMTAGAASTTESWSRLAGAYTTSAHSMPPTEAPQMWARVLLRQEVPGARVSVYRDGAEHPAQAGRMPYGAASVGRLLSTPGFWVAHRGGSYSWPESSMMAYTHAVAHGAPALEVSCHRTSDGVWFLNHDVSLSRVDPSAPATDVREMTWAEVSQYTTLGRPIVRWEALRDAYASSHVIFLDPKNSALEWRSLVEGLDKSRVVLKFSADATWLASQWKAEGWTTWGYMYETQVASGQARQWFDSGVWDLIGMEYSASQETWDTVTSWGVPVLGHIAPDAAAYQTALDKGATGVMLAGVSSLTTSRV